MERCKADLSTSWGGIQWPNIDDALRGVHVVGQGTSLWVEGVKD